MPSRNLFLNNESSGESVPDVGTEVCLNFMIIYIYIYIYVCVFFLFFLHRFEKTERLELQKQHPLLASA